METTNLQKTIGQIFDGSSKYVIPLYQRNFAWRQEQIEQLLQDIYEAFQNNRAGHYFIGSLIVLKRNNGDFEVIDGQQRLTTLSLITKILGINREPRLFYDSRPEVEEFFDEFYKADDHKVKLNYPSITHLKNAIAFIQNAELDPNELGHKLSFNDFTLTNFKDYFSNNVFLVRVEIPADTDVASYFEIMNNRGEQLQKHEILKSLLMAQLTNDAARKEFALIWDACSQMDTPIQKLFGTAKRKKYFGDKYDKFILNEIFKDCTSDEDDENDIEKAGNGISISDILEQSENFLKNESQDVDDTLDIEETESKYKSIIDFPNFLMHILKIHLRKKSKQSELPLNEKYLLGKYKENESDIEPTAFVKLLFYCRTIFDRYVVKTIVDNYDQEDGEKWTLRKPNKYDQSWKYIDSFGNNNDKVIKALSMLQVSYRNRMYKNWLYEVLEWFVDERFSKSEIEVGVDEYIKQLNSIIYNNYRKLELKWTEIDTFAGEHYAKGTATPHFLLNYIDYLYWVDSKSERKIPSSENIKDFEFKYWNSVEHHMAREWAERNNIANRETFIDNLGNLFLISKSANSRLSDRDVKEKVTSFGKGNLGANRQIIYKQTENNTYSWSEEDIRQHYNELVKLLECGEAILNMQELQLCPPPSSPTPPTTPASSPTAPM